MLALCVGSKQNKLSGSQGIPRGGHRVRLHPPAGYVETYDSRAILGGGLKRCHESS